MTEYVLLYRGDLEGMDERMGETEQGRQRLESWRRWMDGVRQKGQLKDVGLPLKPAGKVVRKRKVTDGPFIETKEVIAGFSVIEVADYAEAEAIAAGCPMLEGGGSVEIRPVLRFRE